MIAMLMGLKTNWAVEPLCGEPYHSHFSPCSTSFSLYFCPINSNALFCFVFKLNCTRQISSEVIHCPFREVQPNQSQVPRVRKSCRLYKSSPLTLSQPSISKAKMVSQLQQDLWKVAQGPWESGVLPSAENLARARASLPTALLDTGFSLESVQRHILDDIVPAFNG